MDFQVKAQEELKSISPWKNIKPNQLLTLTQTNWLISQQKPWLQGVKNSAIRFEVRKSKRQISKQEI